MEKRMTTDNGPNEETREQQSGRSTPKNWNLPEWVKNFGLWAGIFGLVATFVTYAATKAVVEDTVKRAGTLSGKIDSLTDHEKELRDHLDSIKASFGTLNPSTVDAILQAINSNPIAAELLSQPRLPLGSIIAWHKNLTGVPPLSDEWAECNGQTVNGPKGEKWRLPDLNGAVGSTDATDWRDGYQCFLRGNAISGVFQLATGIVPEANRYITGTQSEGAREIINGDGPAVSAGSRARAVADFLPGELKAAGGTPTWTHAEYAAMRPVNMSVVWIIRVK